MRVALLTLLLTRRVDHGGIKPLLSEQVTSPDYYVQRIEGSLASNGVYPYTFKV